MQPVWPRSRAADYFLGYLQLAAGQAVVPGHVAAALTRSELAALLGSLDFGAASATSTGQPALTLADRLVEASDFTREACLRLDRWSQFVDVDLLARSHAVLASQILNARPTWIARVAAQGRPLPMRHSLDAVAEWFHAADALKEWLCIHSTYAVDGDLRRAFLASRLLGTSETDPGGVT